MSTKPHIHWRFKDLIFTGDSKWQVDAEEHRKINKYEMVFLAIPKILTELSENTAVREFEAKFKFDRDSATEYLRMEVWTDDYYPNHKLQYDIFTCYCTKDWESKEPIPF